MFRFTVLLVLGVLIGKEAVIAEDNAPNMPEWEQTAYGWLEEHLNVMSELWCPWCLQYCRTGVSPGIVEDYGFKERGLLAFRPNFRPIFSGLSSKCPQECTDVITFFLYTEVRNWGSVYKVPYKYKKQFRAKLPKFLLHGSEFADKLAEESRCRDNSGGGRYPGNPDLPGANDDGRLSKEFREVVEKMKKEKWLPGQVTPESQQAAQDEAPAEQDEAASEAEARGDTFKSWIPWTEGAGAANLLPVLERIPEGFLNEEQSTF